MIVYQASQIAQKIFKSKIEARPVRAGHYMAFKHSISFATDLAANVDCNRFRITSDIVSKLLRATIWSSCAVLFESEQTPFPWTGSISFVTDFAANFDCNWFRIMPDIVSKLLCTAIWSSCAVLFKSEQMPFPRTGHQLRSAALHRIQLGTWGFVPMSYFSQALVTVFRLPGFVFRDPKSAISDSWWQISYFR